jgi:TonB family protein
MIGCSSTQQNTDISAPRLLVHQSLPIIPETTEIPPSHLDLSLLIAEDGSVVKAQLLNSSGNTSWDSLTLATIQQWRFAPAHLKDQPISTWLRIQATVKYVVPLYLSLAEILCTTIEEADSAYDALKQGRDFSELVLRYSVDPSRDKKGGLGKIDINYYPENINSILARLEIDEFTQPIKYGDQYAIFKRLKE